MNEKDNQLSSDGGNHEFEATVAIMAFMVDELAVTHADYSEFERHSNLVGLKVSPNYGGALLYFDADSTFDRVVEVLWTFAIIELVMASSKPKADFPFLP